MSKTKKRPSLLARRAAGVEKKLREWERKLAVAQTKVATYRRKERYYRKKQLDEAEAKLAALKDSGSARVITFEEET